MKVGIIGTGRIARRFVPEAWKVEDIYIGSIYNPNRESAAKFAKEFKISHYTDKLEDFFQSVEAVYIASPHSTHFEYAKESLERGKHVLCEKPFCFEKKQAEELFGIAKKNSVIIMEAIKTAYCPGFCALVEIAQSGIIGEIRDVEACFTRLTPKDTREFRDLHYGGSFTEFGSYVILPVLKLMGLNYQEVRFQSLYAENGIDEYTKAYFTYKKGMATIKTGLSVKSEGQLIVAGTKGYILAESPWWLTKKFEVKYEEPGKRDVYTFPFEEQGLRYEIKAFRDCIKSDIYGVRGVSSQETIAMAEIMEDFLKKKFE